MPLAFEGIRVVDFTQVLSGPVATYQLGLMGAEIIKVESTRGGDIARPMLDLSGFGGGELSPMFLGVNHNKRSVAIDLKHPEGLAAARRLVATADVLVQNFKPGVMDRLGLGYEAVRELRPDIVYCAISGYGLEGPRRGEGALDGAIQASSGLMATNGHPETGPTRTQSPVVDVTTGFLAAFAIASALHRRARTGEGQLLDVAMLDSAMALLNPVYNELLNTGREPGLLGNLSLTRLPTADVFPTADGHVQVTAITDPHIRALLEVLGLGSLLSDPRFADQGAQIEHAEALREALVSAFRGGSTGLWLERLGEAGVPASAIRQPAEVLADPQLRYRSVVGTVPAPDGLPVQELRSVLTGFGADRDGPGLRTPAPRLGEHTREVLAELGFGVEELDRLAEAGAIRAGGG